MICPNCNGTGATKTKAVLTTGPLWIYCSKCRGIGVVSDRKARRADEAEARLHGDCWTEPGPYVNAPGPLTVGEQIAMAKEKNR